MASPKFLIAVSVTVPLGNWEAMYALGNLYCSVISIFRRPKWAEFGGTIADDVFG